MTDTLPIFRFIIRYRHSTDPRSNGLIVSAHALGLEQIEQIEIDDLVFVQGLLNPTQLDRLAEELLSDPITQKVSWQKVTDRPKLFPSMIEVALRPGVTDPVAGQIVRASHEMGIHEVLRAGTGQRFTISGSLGSTDLDLLANRLLANPVIQRYALGEIEPAFIEPAEINTQVDILPIRSMDDNALLACSAERRAALDLAEMHSIQTYFQAEGRDCTDVEFECIAQTWSEHCVHKTFKALIDVDAVSNDSPYPPQVNNLLNSYIRRATEEINAPWVISAFTDNAGIIAFDEAHEVSFKVETHNHPSAIEPFGGANTGVGGVIRDVLGVSAKPIAATDILCFGPQNTPLDELPAGVLHPRRIFAGVVAGVQDYGNKLGLPTVNGAIWFDPGYTSNPLVYCGCVGIAPRGLHRHSPRPGDRVIILGGRTGRDGLRGATFSSRTMDAQTGVVSGASVQIGDPITEKIVTEVLLRARDQGLYTAVTDCGAGGLSSAVGELASEIGADVDLAQVQLKYPGLTPWEIWLSEAQERMVIAVPPENIPALQTLCDRFDVELTNMGAFTSNRHLVVRFLEQVTLDLDNHFLHHGLPQRHLRAAPRRQDPHILTTYDLPEHKQALLKLLAHPNIASKEAVIHIYDHEVQGGTVVKPLSGHGEGPSDGCALKPIGTQGTTGIVLSNGFNPEYGKVDSYRMALCVMDEAVRNAVATGADPDHLAVLDNFCWGDPLRPEMMWSLLEAARGCFEAALANRTPFISGKDSFNNEYLTRGGERQSIPPSLLISAIGLIEDVNLATTMDLKEPGSSLYLVGDFQPTFGGSHYAQLFGLPADQPSKVPLPSKQSAAVYRALHVCQQIEGLVKACHDLSEGGLAVTAAEMVIGGFLGLNLDLPVNADPIAFLFGESAGCLLVEVTQGREAEFLRQFSSLPALYLGRVEKEPRLIVNWQDHSILSIPVSDLVKAWRSLQ